MKESVLLIFCFSLFFSSCNVAHQINQSTCAIEANTRTIDRSTDSINRNLAELEKISAEK